MTPRKESENTNNSVVKTQYYYDDHYGAKERVPVPKDQVNHRGRYHYIIDKDKNEVQVYSETTLNKRRLVYPSNGKFVKFVPKKLLQTHWKDNSGGHFITTNTGIVEVITLGTYDNRLYNQQKKERQKDLELNNERDDNNRKKPNNRRKSTNLISTKDDREQKQKLLKELGLAGTHFNHNNDNNSNKEDWRPKLRKELGLEGTHFGQDQKSTSTYTPYSYFHSIQNQNEQKDQNEANIPYIYTQLFYQRNTNSNINTNKNFIIDYNEFIGEKKNK